METTKEERAAWLAWVNMGRPNNMTRRDTGRLCRDVDTLLGALLLSAVTMERAATSIQVRPHRQARVTVAGDDLALVAAKARAVLDCGSPDKHPEPKEIP